MIVYVASYPRSGNFWVQTLLGNQFKYPATNIHVAAQYHAGYLSSVKQNIKQWFHILSGRGGAHSAENSHAVIENDDMALSRSRKTVQRWFDINLHEMLDDQAKHYPPALSRWMMSYRVPGAPTERYFLANGCPLLKEKDTRRVLAEDGQFYFIKTHFPPYSEYFPGEYVIHLVRNPGAVMWSYYNFKRDIKNKDTSLEALIKRDPEFGWNWSEYYRKWLKAAHKMGDRYFLAKYEEIAADELVFCDKLSEFLGLPILSRELRSFDYYHQMRPLLTREGKASGWEENYSKEQLKLLWQVHGDMMDYFGYPEPNYELGLDKEVH